ncbi:cell wall-binding repeat-containing protein [Clostridium sp. AWRP]|uniref:cell wall-binding repeat-containing protein n=1 Tax=Clostridium sp. AWRP TaxID=2212991 RepID=UPI000FDB4F4F|nr:cell wall-binding repeat-containing protein [Clostridium sp. AWRP]AZV57180.1 hypothetical protein DMR38_11520 [Clostridium sp. AWRP]
MKKVVSKLVVFLCTLSVAMSGFEVTTMADASKDSTSGTIVKDRIYGSNRIETSLKISQNGWPNGANTVVLAQGYGYADALCAAPLAKKLNAPIILSGQNALSDNIMSEIKRLKATQVFLIGGAASLSENIVAQLKSLGISDIQRLGGTNRYETSVKIAQKVGNADSIVVASGNGYADSLSIAPIAASKGMPILLSGSDNLSSEVSNYIKNNNVKKTYVVGGTASIGDSVKSVLPNAERLGGATRFETNLAILKNFKSDLKFSHVYIAEGDGPSGNEFADALSGSALAAQKSAPMVLVYKSVAANTSNFIKSNMSGNVVLTALGSTAVVPDSILDELEGISKGTSSTVDAALDSAINKILSEGVEGEWQALGVSEYGKTVPESYLTNLKKNYKSMLHQPTDYERITLALMAIGQDPTNFDGFNFIEKIYNNKELADQGINAYVFALIALDSGNFTIPSNAVNSRPSLVKEILAERTIDGGWSYGGVTADPDMTAMALISLAPYTNEPDVKSAVDKAFDKLSSLQQISDGGYSSWGTANSESASQVVIALCANGIDPTSKAFTKNGKTPIDSILSYEVEGGGFCHVKGTGYNGMATEQAVQALEAYRMFKGQSGKCIYRFK